MTNSLIQKYEKITVYFESNSDFKGSTKDNVGPNWRFKSYITCNFSFKEKQM